MDERTDADELTRRLDHLGTEPIDPSLAMVHLRGLAEVEPRPARFRFGWRAVAAAAIVGFLAGSTGLAAAGTLPDPAQDFAHDTLARIGVNVPRSTEGCPEGQTFRNHGEYVSAVEAAGGDVEAAAHSECGMPAGRGNGNGNGNGNGSTEAGVPREDTDGDPCTGPPPWAGTHLPREQREVLQAERQALCGDLDDADADVVEPDATEAPAVEEQQPVVEDTTTTGPESTTSTTATTVPLEDATTTTVG